MKVAGPALRRRTWPVVLCLAALVAVGPVPAWAEDDDIVTKMSARRLERILNSFNDVKNLREVKDDAYSFEVDGLKILLFNSGQTMQVAAIFDGRATLERLNQWNLSKKFTRALRNSDHKPVLDSALELTGGVTELNVKEWLKTYVYMLKEFRKFLEEDDD
ncbi:MAG TPA: YbjN domain-containing protein [Gemmatales bacterium]|nr:YbjN domain-containing protein [Gemmatales bacterium]